MEHRVEIVALRDRSTPICSCNGMIHREFFGDRRTANAAYHIFKHLESAMGLDTEGSEEYQIKVSDSMNCPLCSEDLDLDKKDMGLLAESDPSIVSCSNNHMFDAYLKNNTLFLFLEGTDTHSPFSTTQ
jgi:hypothetical protein